MPKRTRIRLYVQPEVSGDATDATYEIMPAEWLGETRYRLLNSPVLALGAAAGDELSVADDGKFTVLHRAGNIAMQFFPRSISESKRQKWRATLISSMEKLGGWLDGESPSVLVITLPIKAGFPKIEAALARLEQAYPEMTWIYGNVYDPIDGVTPLNWWEDA